MTTDGLEFFGSVKQAKDDVVPDGMTVWKYKRLKEAQETEGNLARNESVRVPVSDNEELASLFRQGDLVMASDLETKHLAEEEAQRQFESATEDRQRDNRYETPRPTTKDTTPQWTRHKIEE